MSKKIIGATVGTPISPQAMARANIGVGGYVTPQMYGAAADGVADDTAAINAALATGENVFFPKGKYIVTSALFVPNGARMVGAGEQSVIYTTICDGFVLNTKNTSGEIDTTIQRTRIENLCFTNWCKQDEETKLQKGNFVDKARGVWFQNCRIVNYAKVFTSLHVTTCLIGNSFTGIYESFADSTTDSMIIGNYISGSVYGVPYGSKCFSDTFNSTTFANNFVDYFHDFFAIRAAASGMIIGNSLTRMVNIFHDFFNHLVVTGNNFPFVTYIESDWKKLTAEQIAVLAAEKWCIFKFDDQVRTGTHMMTEVVFTNNESHKCDNYIYIADGVTVIPSACEFRGNQLTTGNTHAPSLVDAGFMNSKGDETARNSFKNVYFDFWDMKEYDELPSPALYVSKAKGVKSFPFMRAICNGELYINVNGEWRVAAPALYDGGVS